jgi:hypothetical protein
MQKLFNKINFFLYLPKIFYYPALLCLLLLYDLRFALPLFFAIVFINSFPESQRKSAVLIVSTIYFFLFSGPTTNEFKHYISYPLPTFSSNFVADYFAHTLFIKLIVALFLLLLLKFFRLFPLAFTLLTFAFVFLNLNVRHSGIASYYILIILVVLSKLFWPYLYFIRAPAWKRSTMIFPFWEHYSIPSGPKLISIEQFDNPKSIKSLQLKGLKLVFWGVLQRTLAVILEQLVHGNSYFKFNLPSLNLPNYKLITLQAYNSLDVTLFERWVTLLTQTLSFLLYEVSGTSAVIVGIARIVGFELPRNTYKPYLATSFNNFLSRLYFYYNQILISFFYWPLLRALRVIRTNRLRKSFSVFVSVFLCGMVVHLLRAPGSFFINSSFSNYFNLMICMLPYPLGLAIATSLSSLLEENVPPTSFNHSKFFRILIRGKFIIYFLLFSILNSTFSNNLHLDLKSQIQFFLRLFIP